jgi:hypothetical protein
MFAYCHVAVAPLRAETSDRSEMVSQLLFGEPVEILDQHDQWRKVRSLMDGYVGWTDEKLILTLTEKEVYRWLDGITTEHAAQRMVKGPFGIQRIGRGSFVSLELTSNFNIGPNVYDWLDEEEPFPNTLTELALNYLNTPYLWGGKTLCGIDCSGFTQVVYRIFDHNLPRDAYQQIELGRDISFDEKSPGDLAFFISDSGRIHHVGIVLENDEVIHASGFIRIDDLTKTGIIRRTDQQISHRLHAIKRL